ncbi:D-serine ammonia-lyase, partial [Aquitalea sp. S1-19]|nr:D-serine ammonia-lyase [Aquitalea sp. S1-19]
MILGKTIESWCASYPLINELIALQETSWFNPGIAPTAEALADVGLTAADVADASARLDRFASYIMQVFPETRASGGIIESGILPMPKLQAELMARHDQESAGQLWLKADCNLPISGSIKARGGIYEVLKHAEDLALAAGLLTIDDDYAKLDSDAMRAFFGQYKVAVGSTGNLGLSIGIMSAQLGFQASVHMSADARQWKKDKLRAHGVTVVEYESDYSVAVAQGRKQAESDPSCHFVDDENSTSLFLGYAVAAERLQRQIAAAGITVDAEHPLFVYLPCGVGGGPGGLHPAFRYNATMLNLSPRMGAKLTNAQFANLHTFLVAARHLSFARAAEELCLTASAVSHRIARLEQSLSLALFHRLTRRVALTEDGERIYRILQGAMGELSEALQQTPQAEVAGAIALYVRPSLAQCWLVPRLANFSARYPHISLDIRVGNDNVD